MDPNTLKSPLRQLVGKLEVYETAKITEDGLFRIVRLYDKRQFTFQEYEDKIEEYLENRKSEEVLREWFEDLESKAEIEIIANLADESQ